MLDSTGFKRRRFADLLADMEAKAKEAFGENVNTSERSVIGIILRLYAWFLAIFWQDAEDVYYSGFKNSATGVSLDRLGPNVGIRRLAAKQAAGEVTITGTPGYSVSAGFRLATEAGIYYETPANVVIGTGGMVTAAVLAVEAGASGNVAAGMVTVIVNPIPDVTAVINVAPIVRGREKETDAEFRERWDLSVSGGGAATVDSLRGALLRTVGVRAAIVVENTKSVPDDTGRPPKSFESYVLGGQPADIGQTILETKAAGIEPFGSESIEVADLSGELHTIKFSYAEELQIHIKAILSVNASYPVNGEALLSSSIVKVIGGEDANGQLFAGLNMGEDVVYSRLIAAAYSVPGIEDIQISLSTDGTIWVSTNLVVDRQQVAQTSHLLIEVIRA